jgi:hypothetical protein
MHRRVALIAIALVTLGAAACGSDDDGSSTTDAPATTTDAPSSTTTPDEPTTTVEPGDRPSPPSDPDAALLTIDGGVPAITADGRVFMRVDGPQGFAAALPLGEPTGALTVAQLTADGLAAVLAEADDLGLLDTPPDYGEPGITDQGYLRVTLATADGTFEHSVYAPGEETGDADADAARARLDEFVHFVDTLQMQLGDEISSPQPYVPEQWIIDTSPYVEQDDVQAWPFAIDPVDGCVSLPSDADADTASGVYSVTVPGEDTDEEHIVEVRPALPFTDC